MSWIKLDVDKITILDLGKDLGPYAVKGGSAAYIGNKILKIEALNWTKSEVAIVGLTLFFGLMTFIYLEKRDE